MAAAPPIQIVPFRREWAPIFVALNLAWIEHYFRVEEADRAVLVDCEAAIVDKGGQIFFAVSDGKVIGTAAIIRHTSTSYELAKMAVAPEAQGRGVGYLLASRAIEFARDAGAERVTLLTNSRLTPALRLYDRLGFVRVPLPANAEYARADVHMELTLRHP